MASGTVFPTRQRLWRDSLRRHGQGFALLRPQRLGELCTDDQLYHPRGAGLPQLHTRICLGLRFGSHLGWAVTMESGRGSGRGFWPGRGPLKKDETAMTRRYNAFLIRHWSLDADQGQRIEVQHVATGKQILVASLSAALAWMQTEIASEAVASRSPPPRDANDPGAMTKPFGIE